MLTVNWLPGLNICQTPAIFEKRAVCPAGLLRCTISLLLDGLYTARLKSVLTAASASPRSISISRELVPASCPVIWYVTASPFVTSTILHVPRRNDLSVFKLPVAVDTCAIALTDNKTTAKILINFFILFGVVGGVTRPG